MIEEEKIPFAFVETGWSEDFSRCSLSNDDVWRYLHSATSTVRQAHRGWSFKEEGYVKHLKLNLQTSDDELGLRSIDDAGGFCVADRGANTSPPRMGFGDGRSALPRRLFASGTHTWWRTPECAAR
ncbi:hypothetical protein HPB51_010175 [Rhipicephalus microplus]|uniref:Uncharacterized protein n=1 Tax=Rhipicephalus microplus TaxID=6941 RepID=A0A9J6F161_RHIMP|nr:hypothetical protein HPB51_010175 [Rhipicephalus microplus]